MMRPEQELSQFWDDLLTGTETVGPLQELELADLIVELHQRAQGIVPSSGQVLQGRRQLLLLSESRPQVVSPITRQAMDEARRYQISTALRIAALVLICVGALGIVQLLGGVDQPDTETISAPVGDVLGYRTYLGDSSRSGVVTESGPTSNPIERWQFSFDASDSILAAPVTTDGMVFAGSDGGRVVALRADTGELVWSVELDGAVRATPVVMESRLIVPVSRSDGTSVIVALSLDSGDELWSATIQGSLLAPLAGMGGFVIAVANDGGVSAFDAGTGAEVWAMQLGGPILAAPAISDGRVVIASRDQAVTALDLATGETLWAFTDAAYPLWSAPMVSEGTVYLFNQPTANAGSTQNLDFENLSAALIALDLTSGRQVWKQEFDWAASSPPPSPVVIGETVNVFSIDRQWRSFDARTGTPVERGEQPEFGHTTYLIGNGVLYLGGRSSVLAAVEIDSMTSLWSIPVGATDHTRLGAPVVENGLVLVADDAGVLHAIGTEEAS